VQEKITNADILSNFAEVIMVHVKKRKISVAFIVVCIAFALAIYFIAEYYSRGYSENVLRFHVIANSNTEQDQALKLKVRDAVGCKISELAGQSESAEVTAETVEKYSEDILKTARQCIKNEGYEYDVKIEIGEFYFPTKHYSEVSLPAGSYEAVRIVIGEGLGDNWWCVLFPPLCFSNGTAIENTGEEKEEITVKFKFVEVFQNVKYSFKNVFQKIF